LQHGQRLRERISRTANFYNDVLFRGQFDLIEEQGNLYLSQIDQFNQGFGDEIRGIAEGSGQPVWQIAALNARTEIYQKVNASPANECTASFFPGTRLLGQNWDWMEPLENLIVVMQITRPDGHKILQMTEPGILAKVGFNSKGLGVCLNILTGGANPPRVPVHILLRSALESDSLEQFRATLDGTPMGTYSNILAADHKGNCLDVEICGDHIRYVDYHDEPIVHTNHFLSSYSECTNEATDESLASSRQRYARGNELYRTVGSDLDRFKLMLADEENAPNEICRAYRLVEGNILGTVTSIIMDLQNQALHITAGKCSENPWQRVTLD
jgi:isopenicillin-N N-acyltransferase-like protein